jgi:hypothetical protein
MSVIVPTNLQMQAALLVDTNGNPLSSGVPASISGPLGRKADVDSVSSALSTEDAALLAALLTTSAFQARVPALGGATSANSVPVTLSTDGPFATNFGVVGDTEATTDTGSFSFMSFVKRLLNTKLKIGQQTKAASLAVTPASDWGAFDSTDRLRASLYGKASAAGDTPILLSSAGKIAVTTSVAFNDATSATFNNPDDSSGNARLMGVGEFLFDGTTWNRRRAMTSNTVLVSAARTATVSTDVTNINGRSFAVILNITAAPNTASTLTIQIRVKDSISGNYVTLLASAAITGSVVTGSVPVTNRYVVALGETVAANVSASEALGRTMNVNVVHSNSDSWTYSISAEIGV